MLLQFRKTSDAVSGVLKGIGIVGPKEAMKDTVKVLKEISVVDFAETSFFIDGGEFTVLLPQVNPYPGKATDNGMFNELVVNQDNRLTTEVNAVSINPIAMPPLRMPNGEDLQSMTSYFKTLNIGSIPVLCDLVMINNPDVEEDDDNYNYTFYSWATSIEVTEELKAKDSEFINIAIIDAEDAINKILTVFEGFRPTTNINAHIEKIALPVGAVGYNTDAGKTLKEDYDLIDTKEAFDSIWERYHIKDETLERIATETKVINQEDLDELPDVIPEQLEETSSLVEEAI